MQVFISRNGQQLGPFSQEEMTGKIKAGEFSLNDFAWYEGLPEWKTVQVVMADLGQAVQTAGAADEAEADVSDKKGTMQISLPKGISKISAKFTAPKG